MTTQKQRHSAKKLQREALAWLQKIAADDPSAPRRRAESTKYVAHALREKLCHDSYDSYEGITNSRVGSALRALEQGGHVDNVGRQSNRARWVAPTTAERAESDRQSTERKRNREQASTAMEGITGLGIECHKEFGNIVLTGSAAMELLHLLPSRIYPG